MQHASKQASSHTALSALHPGATFAIAFSLHPEPVRDMVPGRKLVSYLFVELIPNSVTRRPQGVGWADAVHASQPAMLGISELNPAQQDDRHLHCLQEAL